MGRYFITLEPHRILVAESSSHTSTRAIQCPIFRYHSVGIIISEDCNNTGKVREQVNKRTMNYCSLG
jgi:hypothetical protein